MRCCVSFIAIKCLILWKYSWYPMIIERASNRTFCKTKLKCLTIRRISNYSIYYQHPSKYKNTSLFTMSALKKTLALWQWMEIILFLCFILDFRRFISFFSARMVHNHNLDCLLYCYLESRFRLMRCVRRNCIMFFFWFNDDSRKGICAQKDVSFKQPNLTTWSR